MVQNIRGSVYQKLDMYRKQNTGIAIITDIIEVSTFNVEHILNTLPNAPCFSG